LRAKDALLKKSITKREAELEPAEDLLKMDGMTRDIAYALAKHGIRTMEDLAEQAVDDLFDVEGLDEEKSAELIMTARAPWFAEADKSSENS